MNQIIGYLIVSLFILIASLSFVKNEIGVSSIATKCLYAGGLILLYIIIMLVITKKSKKESFFFQVSDARRGILPHGTKPVYNDQGIQVFGNGVNGTIGQATFVPFGDVNKIINN